VGQFEKMRSFGAKAPIDFEWVDVRAEARTLQTDPQPLTDEGWTQGATMWHREKINSQGRLKNLEAGFRG